jgi:hypothetical protein
LFAKGTFGILREKLLQEKAVEATKQKEEKRKKLQPEEQEGMQRVREKRCGIFIYGNPQRFALTISLPFL